VAVAVLVVLRTGRAVDFFLIQIVTNAASALAWMVSIAIRWPLLGVVVGVLLGPRDPGGRGAHQNLHHPAGRRVRDGFDRDPRAAARRGGRRPARPADPVAARPAPGPRVQ